MDQALGAAKTHMRLNRYFAIGVFLVAFLGYALTVSPTVCFWDCGEYVATCHTLEIPHPPGNPLFIMLGRVVSMTLFFVKDFGLRINLISVVSSAVTAMLMYLIVVRAFVGWMGAPDAPWKRVAVYVGGVVGGLFTAFGSTVWFCSVEAEVNSPLLVPIALCTWLALVWAQSASEKRDRLLVLITYVAFLGIGIHMYSMITLGPLFLYVIIVDPEKRKDWRLWITGVLMGLVMYDISLFFVTGSIALVATLAMALVERRNSRKWLLCFFIALFGMLGFSSHLYIPIRSSLNPMIDENHPATVKAFTDYLNRKQYGSESMISRMFWRRGTWSHQFGVEGRMGFGGFFLTQFFRFSPLDTQQALFARGAPSGAGKLALYLLPAGLLLFGIGFLIKKNRSVAVLLGSMFLMTTVVLVLYMNFADGTKCEKRDYFSWVKAGRPGPEPHVQREVRVRDYFYVAGFAFYGMWIGIAAGGLLCMLFTSRRKVLRTTIGPIAAVLLAASPALPMAQNMPLQTRRGDYTPYDYAYNLLMSCENDGLLFTNGDNDTFPLWALQEAYGIRRDVRIINLSLLNTKWYIKQLRSLEPRVPVALTDEEIEKLNHGLNPIAEPMRYTLPHAAITVNLPTRKELKALRIQDQMVLSIVDANAWRKPVYFAVTVAESNFMGLAPFLQMQGLVYRVMPRELAERDKIDVGRTVNLLDHVYSFRFLGNGAALRNETSKKILSNYGAAFLQIALTLQEPLLAYHREIVRLEKSASPDSRDMLASTRRAFDDTLSLALGKLDQCERLMPWDWRPCAIRHELLIGSGRAADAETAMRKALAREPGKAEYLRMLAQALLVQGKKEETETIARTLMAKNVDLWDLYGSTAQSFVDAGAFDDAIEVVRDFSVLRPGDRRASDALILLGRLKSRTALSAPKASAGTPKPSAKKAS